RSAGNRIEDINRHYVRANLAQGEGEITAVVAAFAHADNAAGTNLDPGILEIADGIDPLFVGVCSAVIREKAPGTLQIMAITLKAGCLEPIGHFLALNQPQGRVGASLAAGGQFFDSLADFVEHGAFIQALPSSH